MKKTIVMALVITAMGAMLIAGGTMALFTSTTANTGNTFTAGTVIISDKTVDSEGKSTLFSSDMNIANLAPGDTKTVQLTVMNEGTLDEWVKIDQDVSLSSATGSLFTGATPVALTFDTKAVRLAPGASTTFNVSYNFPVEADNSYQGATGSFNVAIQSVQARNNTNQSGTAPVSWNE